MWRGDSEEDPNCERNQRCSEKVHTKISGVSAAVLLQKRLVHNLHVKEITQYYNQHQIIDQYQDYVSWNCLFRWRYTRCNQRSMCMECDSGNTSIDFDATSCRKVDSVDSLWWEVSVAWSRLYLHWCPVTAHDDPIPLCIVLDMVSGSTPEIKSSLHPIVTV